MTWVAHQEIKLVLIIPVERNCRPYTVFQDLPLCVGYQRHRSFILWMYTLEEQLSWSSEACCR